MKVVECVPLRGVGSAGRSDMLAALVIPLLLECTKLENIAIINRYIQCTVFKLWMV